MIRKWCMSKFPNMFRYLLLDLDIKPQNLAISKVFAPQNLEISQNKSWNSNFEIRNWPYSNKGRPNMRLLDKAPTDYTKRQQTIQNPDILDKAPTDNTKPRSPTISNAILNIIGTQYY